MLNAIELGNVYAKRKKTLKCLGDCFEILEKNGIFSRILLCLAKCLIFPELKAGFAYKKNV